MTNKNNSKKKTKITVKITLKKKDIKKIVDEAYKENPEFFKSVGEL